MTRIRNLNTPADSAVRTAHRNRTLESAPTLSDTSATRGQTRIGGTAVFLVDSDGGMIVNGTLDGDGTITWTGVSTFNGTNNLNGPTNVNGDLTVGPGGRIAASNLVIDNTGGGRISHPTVLVIAAPATLVNDIGILGNADISGALNTSSVVNMPLNSAPPGAVANVYMAPSGRLYAID